MSYILDALRRADAERERGAVPGLHARPIPAEPLPEPAAERRAPGWAIGAGVAAFGFLALGAGWWLMRPAAAPSPAPAVAAAAPPFAVPIQQQAPPPMPIQVAPQVPLPLPPQAPPQAPPQPPVAAMSPALPPPVPIDAPPKKPERAPKSVEKAADKPIEKPAAKAPVAAPAAPPALAPEPAGPPPTPVAQLPEQIKRELPPISIGGSIYSADAPSRFVMINGQVVREGEPAATGIVLERIGPKSAILRWREWRIEVPL